MSKRTLPDLRNFAQRGNGLQFEPSHDILARWNPAIRAADEDTDNVISILDMIGEDWMGNGVTSKRIAAALRRIGAERDVVVHLNSPGGDFFEGTAIYNMLREHKGAVTVRVLGLAASAASVIAMAGDTIQVARAGFFMIHNTSALAIGNRHDMRDLAATLEVFDAAMADVYADRTGLEAKDVAAMMDKDTWLAGVQAVDQGFADDFLPSDAVAEAPSGDGAATAHVNAARRIDAMLARAGIASRAERRELIKQIRSGTQDAAAPPGAPGAAGSATQDAGDPAPEVEEAVAILRTIGK